MDNHSSQKGFTLLELIIAISITALIGIAANSMLDVMLRSKTQVTDHQKQLTELDTALRILQRDLQQITPLNINGEDFPSDNFGLLLRPHSQSVGTTFMEFVRYTVVPDPTQVKPELIKVRYKVIDGSLIREQRPFVAGQLQIEWHPIQLLTNIETLEIEVFQNQWRPLYSELDSPALPYAIKLTLTHPQWETAELLISLPGASVDEA